jgi:hypothetical protein
MKILKPALTVAILLGSLVCNYAWAQHGHGGGGHGGPHGGAHFGAHPGPHFGNHTHAPVRGYHGGRGYWRGGVFIGAPLVLSYPWYGAPRYDPYYGGYYAGVPMYLPPEFPPSDIAPGLTYWYYCANPGGYYPSVAQCRVPWRVVTSDGPPP